ncbi:MAG: hypothetical protein AB1717_06325 [Pseudomonadota bacterium]
MHRSRFGLFTIHLLLTLLLLILLLGIGYIVWYAWPAWYLLEAERVTLLLVFSVLMLGPFASLLVNTPGKAAHLLRMNLVVIGLLQFTALAAGAWTLWQGRPLFYVLTIDRIELMTAADFDSAARSELQDKKFNNPYSPLSQVDWVWAPLPENTAEKEAIILSAILDDKDITQMPGYFRPWSVALDDLRRQLHPLSDLTGALKIDVRQVQQLALSLGQNETELGWLRLDGSRRGGAMIFHRLSGKPLRFVAQR